MFEDVLPILPYEAASVKVVTGLPQLTIPMFLVSWFGINRRSHNDQVVLLHISPCSHRTTRTSERRVQIWPMLPLLWHYNQWITLESACLLLVMEKDLPRDGSYTRSQENDYLTLNCEQKCAYIFDRTKE